MDGYKETWIIQQLASHYNMELGRSLEEINVEYNTRNDTGIRS